MKRAVEFGLAVAVAAGLGARCAVASAGAAGGYAGAAAATVRVSQGYLGVDVRDVNDDEVGVLKLKEARGAEITLVDHDAPAGKAGLRERDVVLQMNGQPVEGEEQIRRMLRQCPPGRTVVLVISRDGQQITVSTQMANREEVERRAWEQHLTVPEPPEGVGPELDNAGGNGGYTAGAVAPAPALRGNSFMGTILMSPAYTGAMLEQLSTQLAQFFGVPSGSGLLVRSVADGSPAAAAGMHAGDVVVKANAQRVATTNDWAKALKNSRGKPMTVTVLREKKEQTLTLVPDGKRRSSVEELIAAPERAVVARLGLSWMGGS
jgi:S1-C subfamily serine protease